MNPISALRWTANPALGQPAGEAAGAPIKVLSPAEMEVLSPGGPQGLASAAPTKGFDGMLQSLVSDVANNQAAAGQAVSGLLSGQQVPLHQAVIAMEEASVSFQLMVEVRNKLLESYQELMRMQI